MKVALRDDDTSFFTTPEQLHAVYHDIWDRLPVSLAVVPRAAGYRDKAIPEKYWEAGRVFPLEENTTLVEFLRERLAAGFTWRSTSSRTSVPRQLTSRSAQGSSMLRTAPD